MLMYLRFTQPRADPTTFAGMKAQAIALLPNRTADPEVVLEQTLNTALSGGNPRRQPETPATVQPGRATILPLPRLRQTPEL
jgi:hypothetical protein